ncbi:MAG: inositol monophosphatase [Muribaculaceae bacterium]|nr:inositol monophosphatase [Muribaculaceae bacterium]
MSDYDKLLEFAISLAKQAGEIQLSYFRDKNLSISTKQNDFDIVTAADKASEKIISGGIRLTYPTHSILSEESGLTDSDTSEYLWVVDPLDGTTNFSAGLPLFNVSIGVKHKGETVVGVVYAPYLGELFTAVKGRGAFLNGERIHASEETSLSRSVITTGFPYDKAVNKDNNLDNVERVLPVVRGLRRLGSAALDISYVAAGFLDGFWELALHEWDVCAATLIATEAGARVESLRPDRIVSIVVAPEGIFGQLRALLAPKPQNS